MFRIIFDNGIHSPIFKCEVCKKLIESATDGLYYYGHKVGGDSTEIMPEDQDKQIVVHRKCCEAIDDDFLYFHELSTVLVWLADNLGFKGKVRKDTEQRAGLFAEMF